MQTFSIIITTHNRPVLLSRAIQSVKAQLQEGDEIIVVSDVYCAETEGVVASLLNGQHLFVQRKGQPGPAESRNLGITLARGDLVVFLDDDDALSGQYVSNARQLSDGRDVLYTDYFAIWERLENGSPVPVSGERRSLGPTPLASIYAKNFIPPACLIYPRASIADKRFDPDLVLNEDWDFILNVMTGASLRYVPIDGPIVFTRETADNRSRNNDHRLVDTYRTIYKNRPAPTQDQKLARQSFFASCGLTASLADL